MTEDTGRSLRDGLSPSVEPASSLAGSAASIPSAGDWVVVRESSAWGWARFGAAQVAKVTPKLVKFVRRGSLFSIQVHHDQVLASFQKQDDAERVVQSLQNVARDYVSKRRNADREAQERIAKIRATAEKQLERVLASAIEARRAETRSGSVADESAVPQADAHTHPGDPA